MGNNNYISMKTSVHNPLKLTLNSAWPKRSFTPLVHYSPHVFSENPCLNLLKKLDSGLKAYRNDSKQALSGQTLNSLLPGIIAMFLIIVCSLSDILCEENEVNVKEHVLYSVTVPGAPIIIKNKRIMYGLDMIFDTVPGDFWVYYSENNKKLVVDFYGIHIAGEPKVELTGRGVFQDVMIDNYTTNLALSKKRSTILVGVVPDPGWHFKAIAINSRTLRITAWKDITGLTKIERRKKIVGRYFLITALVSLLTFVSIYAVSQSSN